MKKVAFVLLVLLADSGQAGQPQGSPLPSQAISAELVWLNDSSQAVAKAKETGKPILIDCFADWCIWCHKMEEEVFSDPKFIEVIRDYIPLRIDIEDGAQGTHLAEQYEVNSLPTLLLIDSDGVLLNRISGYLQTDELIDEITSIQTMIDRERLNADDWVAVQTLAEEYLIRDMNAEAERRFLRLLQAPVSDAVKESAHFSLALAQYYQGKNVEALHTLERYLQIYVDGESAEDVLLLLAQIYMEMGSHDRAKQTLERFLRLYPNSKSAGRARKVLDKLM